MISLKAKAAIYRYTGLFLAESEFEQYARSKLADLGPFTAMEEELEIYLLKSRWQARNGFTRPLCFLKFRRPAIIFKPLAWIVTLYLVLKKDLKY